MEGALGLTGIQGNTYEINLKLRVFDEEALELAFEDLENSQVIPPGETYKDNTIEENLALILKNLDVLANYREIETIAFIDMGFEQVQ